MGDRGKLILVSDICCFDYWVSHCTHFICRTFPSVKARSGHMRMHKRRWFFWFQDVSLRLWYPGALSHWISIRTATGQTKLNDICSGSYGSAIVFLRNTCEKSDCPLQAIRLVFVMWKERAGTKVAILARLKTAVPFHPKWKGQQPKPSARMHLLFASLEQFYPAEQAGPSSSSNPLLLLLPNRSLWYPLIQKT